MRGSSSDAFEFIWQENWSIGWLFHLQLSHIVPAEVAQQTFKSPHQSSVIKQFRKSWNSRCGSAFFSFGIPFLVIQGLEKKKAQDSSWYFHIPNCSYRPRFLSSSGSFFPSRALEIIFLHQTKRTHKIGATAIPTCQQWSCLNSWFDGLTKLVGAMSAKSTFSCPEDWLYKLCRIFLRVNLV